MCKKKCEILKQEIEDRGRKIEELEAHSAGLDREVAVPWKYLCGLAGAATSAWQIRVLTSSANGEAWGGRELEWPERWIEEMRASAESVASGYSIKN
jgi:hypothetical protein